MVERSATGVLGMITAGLALAALAAQHSPRPAALPVQRDRPPSAAPTAPALRALRDGERIDINRAPAADLELLPGVGPTLARRIVAHRAARGPFGAPEELLQVQGIGGRTLERLAPLITLGNARVTTGQPSSIQTTPAVTPK
jgi:competence ComEA-like helix-hairpin-helix protein